MLVDWLVSVIVGRLNSIRIAVRSMLMWIGLLVGNLLERISEWQARESIEG